MFKEISYTAIDGNLIELIAKQWMLITAGDENNSNCMTANWGGVGYLWNAPVAFIFVRPQRYTYDFVEKNRLFTLSFFDKRKYKDILTFCGTRSGRDFDKVSETGLRIYPTPNGSLTYEQAKLAIECKKIYYNDIDPDNFLDSLIRRNYPDGDYHRMFIGKIVACYKKNS